MNGLTTDINRILSKGKKFVMPSFKITLHTPEEDYKVSKILHVDITRDYVNKLTDEIELTFMMPLGDYRDVIYRNLDKLEVTLEIDFKDKLIDNKYTRSVLYRKRFRFIPRETDKRFDDSKYEKFTRDELNNMDMKTVTGVCRSLFLIGLKQLYVNGIYKEYTLDTLLKMLYTKLIPKADVAGKVYSLKFAFEKFDNEDEFNHVIIDNKKLITLPYQFQKTDYGIYNGGIGLYFTHDFLVSPIHEDRLRSQEGLTDYTMYLYPLYDHLRFTSTEREKLIIYSTPYTRESANNITYYRNDNETGDYEILTPTITIDNKKVTKLFDNGDSLYKRNPATVLTKPYMMEYFTGSLFMKLNDLVEVEKTEENDTFIRNYRDTNYDYNTFKYHEEILKSMTILGHTTIPKADFRIFYPGMPVKYLYTKNNTVETMYGTIYKVVTTFNIVKESSSTALVIGLTNMKG